MKKKLINNAVCFFILFFMFSCSEDPKGEVSKGSDNFIGLSLAKEIGGEVTFEKKGNTYAKNNTVEHVKKTIKTIHEAKNESGKTSFYIINYNEGGFIILSADNRTEPVLAFSDESKFVVEEESYPLGLKFWLTDTKKQIDEIQHSNIKQSEINKMLWKKIQLSSISSNRNLSAKPPVEECYDHEEINIVGPLLNTTWHQSGSFNDALNYINCNGSNFQVLAGCVPVAMAQVMKYYKYPARYNWSAMPIDYGTTTTANLILDIHNAIRTSYSQEPSYSCSATGVDSDANMGNVLKNHFNYASATRSDYNQQTVKDNLNAGRPVILSGSGGGQGHMWVCDGFIASNYYFADCTGIGTLMLSMNWGWANGYNNGWYTFNNFNPGSYSFNSNRKMIYNIMP